MQNREQVIKRLERCVLPHSRGCTPECEYHGRIECCRQVMRNALALLKQQEPRVIGRWKQLKGAFTTPGGTPYYVCGACGGSGHLNGCEYPRRKVICDTCGRINLYPWERAYEEGSSLWEDDEEEVKQDGSIV